MRPRNLKTRIFLDSGDPLETRAAFSLLGFLDGQTTNPTLIGKHPEAKKRIERGERFPKDEIIEFYRDVVIQISTLIPQGSVSIEVYADHETSANTLFAQGRDMFGWIPNAHIKYPTTAQGLMAAERSVAEHMRINMTLCFSQEQAAAVYGATRGAKPGDVFVSPFVGRLDDRGENGMDLIKNCIRMYRKSDGHVHVLTASVRNLNQFMYALALGSDIITAPLSILKEWAEKGMPVPEKTFVYAGGSLAPIPYCEIDLRRPWQSFDIAHPLTEKGMQRFSDDWNTLIEL